MLVPVILMALMISSVTIPYAFADKTANRDWEFWEQWKLYQVEKAKKKQNEYYKFDYSDIQNKDKGFKTTQVADVKKKHIQNEIKQNFKVIKNLNN